jgi:hypothetical protein
MSTTESEVLTVNWADMESEVEKGKTKDFQSTRAYDDLCYSYKRDPMLEQFCHDVEQRSKTLRDNVMKVWQLSETLHARESINTINPECTLCDSHDVAARTRKYNLQSSADYAALETLSCLENWNKLLSEGRLCRDDHTLNDANFKRIMGMKWPPKCKKDISSWKRWKERL